MLSGGPDSSTLAYLLKSQNYGCTLLLLILENKKEKLSNVTHKLLRIKLVKLIVSLPATLGHLLVIPKKHIPHLHLLNSEEIQEDLFGTLIRACNMLVNSKLCSDYDVIQSNGPYADQDVEHIHFHIIPRYINDNVCIQLDPHRGKVSLEELNELGKLINDPNHKKT